MKKCKQCMKSNPMVVRWVMYNYGQIPWDGFLMPKEKELRKKIKEEVEARIKANKETLYTADEEVSVTDNDYSDYVRVFSSKEINNEREDAGADEERAD